MSVMGLVGAVDVQNAIVGNWPDVNFLSVDGDRINLGNVTNGVLEMSKEDFVHFGTAVPRIADYVVPMSMGMRFSGEASEFHYALFHALIGDALSNTSQYIYPGVQQCSTFFTLQAMRRRSCDEFVLEARIYKCHPGNMLSLGANDTADVTMPFSVEGLDDQADAMGQGGSSTSPLGYFFVPVPGANVVTNVSVP